ncbi:GH32 C-terminal domain-containing protein [Bacillus sp. OTU530]
MKIDTTGGDMITLHMYVDRSSLELLIDDGELAMTSRIYPDPASLGME